MTEPCVEALSEMGIALTKLALKGTVTAIAAKVKSIKNENKVEVIRNTYDEIVNELLSEREEAVRIAQTYKAEMERIEISDDDIEHLYNTVSRILEIIKQVQLLSSQGKSEEDIGRINAKVQSLEQLKELISVDTLKTMQLLGFNYKAAIGEPLTEICAKAITAFGERKNLPPNKRR